MLPGRSPGDRSLETQRIIYDCSVVHIHQTLQSIHIDISNQRTTQQGGSEAQRSASLRGSTHTHTHINSTTTLRGCAKRTMAVHTISLLREYISIKVESRRLAQPAQPTSTAHAVVQIQRPRRQPIVIRRSSGIKSRRRTGMSKQARVLRAPPTRKEIEARWYAICAIR